MVARRKPHFIDLFSGCGGLTQGFSDAGWQPVFAVELIEPAVKTHMANFDCAVWNGMIQDFIPELEKGHLKIPPVDAVIGGPPCQGFSPLGKMSAKAERKEHHENLNDLWSYFLRVVELLKPEIFVTENVPEFLKSEEFERDRAMAEGLGYSLSFGVLKAEEYGVPQKRRRAFCIGMRKGIPDLPSPNGVRSTVRDAIGHLPLKPTEQDWHIGRNPTPKSLERYKVIPPGGNRFDLMRERPDITPDCWLRKKTGTTDVFGRMKWDDQSGTIRTEFFKPEKGRYLHPQAHRPITHREAACIQTFPESFVFEGSRIEVARQIGEAVPPRLACAVGKHALKLLRKRRSRQLV
jgi:DNA (cytosine-5)-methyltransferase 1